MIRRIFMKRISLLLSLLLSLSLTGCNVKKVDPPSITSTSYTKDDLIKIFYSHTSHSKDTVLDCAIINDHAFHLIGVIQYMDEHNNPCNIDFISEDKTCIPSGFLACAGLTNSPYLTLTYLGDGKILCSFLENETLKSNTYYMQYKNMDTYTNIDYY